ncbi:MULTISPECIES: phosphotransferase system, HPr-related protein [unclassified Pseudomonas]|uniref:phosphotransferase system, HPr-related protein n=1 Tax=unclassified Pseudomonas TaxID=196821 RepID=UPI00244BB699|nr:MULTISPECIES: phosphotransferase system, HPr-related protein [unclassified Pseudomonas]MDG9930108.1 phosphotransferase system, HPr-related protein [Pseudomonas sp. GD04042]MDH0483490.1 phosphotransferase system, HPr-related protein [Pseudomonas sp. GD04015]MDH0605486.1 phosphotransferase system, HPr-related protein [Pseudomonas sp. GD03869]
MSEHKPRVTEIDDIEDRMGSMHELDFSERRDERQGRIGDERPADEVAREFPPEREAQAGMSGGEALSESVHEDNVTLDDLSPETLIDESGAYSPGERGEVRPADKELSVVDGSEIGGGIGLDEAELARSAPLDGQPWTDQVSPPEGGEER